MEVSEFRRKHPGEISLLTYNIVGGMKAKQVIEDILSLPEKPEIICFQEYPTAASNTLFKKAFEDYHFIEKPLWQMSIGPVGLATLIQKESSAVTTTQTIILPASKGNPIEKLFLLLAAGKSVPIKRASLITRVRLGRRELLIANTHLSWEGTAAHKINQLRSIFNEPIVKEFKGPTIICGDFNLISKSPGGRRIQSETFKHGFNDLSLRCAATYNFLNLTSFPEDRTIPLRRLLTFIPRKLRMRIGVKVDYIFGRLIKTSFSRSLPFDGSDHYPLLAYLEV